MNDELRKLMSTMDMSIVYHHDTTESHEGYAALDSSGELMGGTLYETAEQASYGHSVAIVEIQTRSVCTGRLKGVKDNVN